MFFRYAPIEEAAKILYIKTEKLPKYMSKKFHFTGEHNTQTIENYSINAIFTEAITDNINLYGKETNSGKFELIPLEELQNISPQKIEKSNRYGLYIDNKIKNENLQYTELAVKTKDLSKIIKKRNHPLTGYK